ncbi:hypothetical protein BH24ACT22_BH24ACT22_10510 [soil metagenome]
MKVTPFPTLVTCGNLAAGFLALLLAIEGNYSWAAGLVVVAAVLDLLDGAVARGSGTDGDFGCNLDSLADLISFGVVPAATIYLSSLHSLTVLGAAAGIFYVVCGALRLARFPLVKSPDHFVGLPIPPAGVTLAVLALLGLNLPLVVAATVVLGLLMVSEVPFPKTFNGLLPERSRNKKRPFTEDL